MGGESDGTILNEGMAVRLEESIAQFQSAAILWEPNNSIAESDKNSSAWEF